MIMFTEMLVICLHIWCDVIDHVIYHVNSVVIEEYYCRIQTKAMKIIL